MGRRGPAPTRRLALVAAWEALPSPRPSYEEAAKIIGMGATGASLKGAIARTRATGVPVKGNIDLDELLDEWAFLRDVADEHWHRAAPRLGLTRSTFYDILHEARRAGDPRGATTRQEVPIS
jgi:hypothetical protein